MATVPPLYGVYIDYISLELIQYIDIPCNVNYAQTVRNEAENVLEGFAMFDCNLGVTVYNVTLNRQGCDPLDDTTVHIFGGTLFVQEKNNKEPHLEPWEFHDCIHLAMNSNELVREVAFEYPFVVNITYTPLQTPSDSPSQSRGPSVAPSTLPTLSSVPSTRPSSWPSPSPSFIQNIVGGTDSPTPTPTLRPTTAMPSSVAPTLAPTGVVPTRLPSVSPFEFPFVVNITYTPLQTPSDSPSQSRGPSVAPSTLPTLSSVPSSRPSSGPSPSPSFIQNIVGGTDSPTPTPTLRPTTAMPSSVAPTVAPTGGMPTITRSPSLSPTRLDERPDFSQIVDDRTRGNDDDNDGLPRYGLVLIVLGLLIFLWMLCCLWWNRRALFLRHDERDQGDILDYDQERRRGLPEQAPAEYASKESTSQSSMQILDIATSDDDDDSQSSMQILDIPTSDDDEEHEPYSYYNDPSYYDPEPQEYHHEHHHHHMDAHSLASGRWFDDVSQLEDPSIPSVPSGLSSGVSS